MYNNYNMNYVSSSSRKLLYITVAVAALFVAVVSGTFAYFQASASSNNITGTLADVGITLTVEKMTSTKGSASNGTSLIPFNLINSSNTLDYDLLTNSSTGAIPLGCIDNYGYTACDIFKISVKSNSSINVDGYLKIGPSKSTDIITNVKWILLGPKTTTSASKIENISSSIYNTSYLVASKAYSPLSYTDYNAKETSGSDTYLGSTFTTASTGDTLTTSYSYYYVMVWLEDTDDSQDDEGNYVGTVTFSGLGDTQGRVTASFG